MTPSFKIIRLLTAGVGLAAALRCGADEAQTPMDQSTESSGGERPSGMAQPPRAAKMATLAYEAKGLVRAMTYLWADEGGGRRYYRDKIDSLERTATRLHSKTKRELRTELRLAGDRAVVDSITISREYCQILAYAGVAAFLDGDEERARALIAKAIQEYAPSPLRWQARLGRSLVRRWDRFRHRDPFLINSLDVRKSARPLFQLRYHFRRMTLVQFDLTRVRVPKREVLRNVRFTPLDPAYSESPVDLLAPTRAKWVRAAAVGSFIRVPVAPGEYELSLAPGEPGFFLPVRFKVNPDGSTLPTMVVLESSDRLALQLGGGKSFDSVELRRVPLFQGRTYGEFGLSRPIRVRLTPASPWITAGTFQVLSYKPRSIRFPDLIAITTRTPDQEAAIRNGFEVLPVLTASIDSAAAAEDDAPPVMAVEPLVTERADASAPSHDVGTAPTGTVVASSSETDTLRYDPSRTHPTLFYAALVLQVAAPIAAHFLF